MLVPRPFKSTALVVTTWWLILLVGAFLYRPDVFSGSFTRAAIILSNSALGAAVGIVCAIVVIGMQRLNLRLMLSPDEQRGLQCSLGPVPVLIKEPKFVQERPRFTAEGFPGVPENFVADWFDKYGESHPKQAALMDKLLRVYAAYPKLPATHVPGGHGGNTLFQHSLLCSYVMHKDAYSWVEPLLNPDIKPFKKKNESYKFDPEDPMCAIIGLAHDMGKIEALIWENNEIVGMKHEHDMTGARMLARMPEVWDLDEKDKFALMMSVAHYHRPMDLPSESYQSSQAIDDRTVNLMELLIISDRQTACFEKNGRFLTEEEKKSGLNNKETGSAIEPDDIWAEFSVLLMEHGRINTRDPSMSIGTYCQVAGANTALLVLHEETLRMVLAQRLKTNPENKTGDGRSFLTIELLKLLHAKGALRTSMKCINNNNEVVHYSPESALWFVGFWKQGKSAKDRVNRITSWTGIICDPNCIPGFELRVETYPWLGRVERGIFGDSRAKAVGEPGQDESAAAQTGATDQTQPSAAPTGDSQAASAAATPGGVSTGDESSPQGRSAVGGGAGQVLAAHVQPPQPASPAQLAVDAQGQSGASTQDWQQKQGDVSSAAPEEVAGAPAGAAMAAPVTGRQEAVPTTLQAPVARFPASADQLEPPEPLPAEDRAGAAQVASPSVPRTESPVPESGERPSKQARASTLSDKRGPVAKVPTNAFSRGKAKAKKPETSDKDSLTAMLKGALEIAQARGLQVSAGENGFVLSSDALSKCAPDVSPRDVAKWASNLAKDPSTGIVFHLQSQDPLTFFVGVKRVAPG